MISSICRYQSIFNMPALLGFICLFSLAPFNAMAQQWQQYDKPEEAGWSSKKLDQAREFASRAGSAAVLVVDRGHVVVAWGDVQYPFKSASIRKSIYDIVLGVTHFQNAFDVQTKLGTLEINDLDALTTGEKSATFEQLMTARSGVYHAAAYETAGNAKRRPNRGSHVPGAFWYYNNWDFNVIAPCFEKLSGQSIQSAFEENVAKPLGMEDYQSQHIFECLEPRVSLHPALTFRISARDLARLGKLYLQRGLWEDARLVDEGWIRRSTTPTTTFEKNHYRGEGNGYGRLWWIFPARPERKNKLEACQRIVARGTGGQAMLLIPEHDILIVHLSDTDRTGGITGKDQYELLRSIMAAKSSKPNADPSLGPVKPKRLKGQPNRKLNSTYDAVTKEMIGQIEGTYTIASNIGMRMYRHQDRLFVQPMGMPYPDVELFLIGNGKLGNPVVPIEFKFAMGKEPVGELEFTFEGRTMKCRRQNR